MAEAQQTRFDEILEKHRMQAANEGKQEGRIEGEREMLCRMAARSFDAETVERFTDLLRPIDDPARLTEIFEAMFDCKTPEELLALVQNP